MNRLDEQAGRFHRRGSLSVASAAMRHPRMVLVSSLVGLAALVMATGCGVAADDTAATVDGTVIKASLVNELATSDPFMSAMTSQALTDQRAGVVDGDDARLVLTFLIQRQVLAREAERWDATVTDQDRATAEQAIQQQASQLTASQRSLVAGFLADRDALTARLAKVSSSKEDDLRAMYDLLGSYWDQVCMTAVAVPTNAERATERALARGTKLTDLPKRVKSVQVVLTDRRCITAANLPGVLRSRVHGAARGAVVGPVTGIYPEDQAVLWFVVGSRRRVSFDDARDELRQIADSLAKQGAGAWLTLVLNQGVFINPQYGSGIDVDQQGLTVVPPALPLGAGAAPGAPTGDPDGGTGAAPDGTGSSPTP